MGCSIVGRLQPVTNASWLPPTECRRRTGQCARPYVTEPIMCSTLLIHHARGGEPRRGRSQNDHRRGGLDWTVMTAAVAGLLSRATSLPGALSLLLTQEAILCLTSSTSLSGPRF